jgi:nitrogen regulatory protein P-II 1
MIKVTAYIKPYKLEPVKSAIAAEGVNGLSVGDVRGTGNSTESSSIFSGQGVLALPIRARLEAVVPDELAEPVVAAILASCSTGESDDGKIFLERVEDAVRIRTMERGDHAV